MLLLVAVLMQVALPNVLFSCPPCTAEGLAADTPVPSLCRSLSHVGCRHCAARVHSYPHSGTYAGPGRRVQMRRSPREWVRERLVMGTGSQEEWGGVQG